ncbi:MAG: MmgE/PrpD family protein [Candidatus Tectimicrobiota bacterium]
MGTTQQLATFVQQTTYEALPVAAVARAKQAIIDTIGTTLAGATDPAGDILTRYVTSLGGAPQASILGKGVRTSAPQAALVNGTMAHAYDYDDVNWSMSGHPSVPLVPALLAVGEAQGVSGQALLTAYILGFEVEAKIGRGINPTHYQLGWHATATLGVLGAAVAVAKLLRLSAAHTAVALGLAASMASGLRQNFGTMTKPLHPGQAAMHGVMAATLAQMGFTADPDILEAPFGFARLFTGGTYALEPMTATLGQPYDVLEPGIVVKQYPCCAFTHRALDGMLALVEKHQLTADEVEAVECVVSQLASDVLIHPRPTTGLEGKFSLEYCLAAALLDRQAGLGQFTDAMVQRPQVQAFLPRISRHTHPLSAQQAGANGEELPVMVTVKLRDGRKYTQQVEVPKGHPDLPLSEAELHAKFRTCAGLVLPPAHVERALEMLVHLEQQDSIAPCMALLA